MLDIQKELEKFNSLLEEFEREEARVGRAADASDSGTRNADQEDSDRAEYSAATGHEHHLEQPSQSAGAGDVSPDTVPAVPQAVRAEVQPEPDVSASPSPLPVADKHRAWTVVEHVHPEKPAEEVTSNGMSGASVTSSERADREVIRERDQDVAPAARQNRQVPRTIPSGLPQQHVAAFDSLMKGARTALTDTHRQKPKGRAPVTVTLPSLEELEQDVVRERSFREKIVPMFAARAEQMYDRVASIQDGLALLENRMSVVVGVAAAVVLVAAGLAIIPRMLSGDPTESAEFAATMSESDSVHLLSSADGLTEPERATLTVSTFPPGARVYLGSELIGVTPFRGISVDRGFQSITIKKADYLPVDTTLTIEGPASMFFELKTDPAVQFEAEVDMPVQVDAERDQSGRADVTTEQVRQSSSGSAPAIRQSSTAEPQRSTRRERESSAPARSATGSLVITSDPSGASIFIDDEAFGTTPLTVDEIEAGRKTLTMQRDGYVPYEIELNVMPSLQTPFHAVLAPLKGRVELRVVGGVDLYVDGELVQRSAQAGYVALVNVGQRSLRLVHADYGEWTTSVSVRADETTPVEVDLEAATFSAAVERGDRLFSESSYAEAIESYSRALRIRPGNRGVENKLGLAAKAMTETDAPSVDASGVYTVAETAPELIGGLEALHAGVEYPQEAYDAGVQGRVYIQLTVDENGRAQDIKITKGLPMGCNDAAIRAVERARFKPGMVGGRPVKVRQTLFVNFTIN